MNNIKLVYWNQINLGDLLSPYIISKLSGLPIIHKNFYMLGVRGQINLLLSFLLSRIPKNEFLETLFFFERNLLAVGSILAWGNKRSIIWGSGFMNQNESFRGGQVCAVRGKLTNERLISMGFKGCNVFGDPALLLPLFISPVATKIHDIAIIPHWREFDYFQGEYGNRYKILDIRTANIESFVAELTSCRHVLSTSLHGIILSHAYGIPALWIKKSYIDTDGFKFYDYFSSVEIPFYSGIIDFDSYLSKNDWRVLFGQYEKYILPYKNIYSIQKELLSVAPFRVLNQYRRLFK
ncbi:polysaccharide pyruvyl transferase family protein [uncultured Bacteroides sp.]|uniref:polysaccharide pyruvyl transferase family protein n=1 Tax=uncultured Bacteroides sp. TaxID=162156 RepID=UPI00280AD651|nr:polysaccharide pyruvyl transferase family protein [uncultured Bacteroides sp.]